MKEKHKRIQRVLEAKRAEEKQLRDEDGRVVVDMRVADDTDFLSVFSKSDTPMISPDVAEFLESSTEAVTPGEDLTLRVRSDCIDDREKEVYQRAVKEYYEDKYFANKNELRRNRVLTFLFGVFGVLILAFSLFIDHRGNAIWSEVVDIVAWVLLWEAVDISVFENRSLRIKEKRYLSFIDMKIEYYPDKER